MSKRVFDLAMSVVLLVLASPLLLLAAVAISLARDGPILFRQTRIGRYGRPFAILKFRTMRRSENISEQLTVGRDPRITRVGAVLRRWKLDELPQLLNVIRGDMSIVGPRPEVPDFVADYPEHVRRLVLAVRPGITDWASIKYRDENDLLDRQPDPGQYYRQVILPDKLRIATAYVSTPTLREDVRIIFATICALLVKR